MKRRVAVIATLTVAAATLAAPAFAAGGSSSTTASSPLRSSRADTNGCVVLIPLELAVCIPRY